MRGFFFRLQASAPAIRSIRSGPVVCEVTLAVIGYVLVSEEAHAGCRESGMSLAKARIALFCVGLVALVLQLAPLTWRQPRTPVAAAAHGTAPSRLPPECELSCSHGGAAEPTATDRSLPSLLPLPMGARLVVYSRHDDGWTECALGAGVVLQLPVGSTQLLRSEARPPGASREERAAPDGSLLRLPRLSSQLAPEDAGEGEHCQPGLQAAGDSARSARGAEAARLLSAPHSRCIVPAGALISTPASAAGRKHLGAAPRRDASDDS